MAEAPVREGLFARDDDGAPYLVGGRCPRCERDHFPAQPTCPYCGAGDVEGVRLPTTGRLWAWTAVQTAPPGYLGEVPFGFGVVELDGDALRVVTRVEEPDPSRLEFGQAMRLVLVPLTDGEDGAVTYSFAPA